jgi:hypothetical protein
LVVENQPGAADAAAEELRASGHTVVSCHEPGGATFPCRGITDPGACPLRSHPVDVALLVRAGRDALPTEAEEGARCALVHRVPLVVAGEPVLDPYDTFATRTLGRTYDVVDACELAATAPVEDLSRRATAVLREVVHDAGSVAEVTRNDGRLRVSIRAADDLTNRQHLRAAVRVAMALRELDPFAAGIDIGTDRG